MQHAWAAAPSYFKEIRRFPMLNAEEEQVLVARWREVGDGGAAHKLLTCACRKSNPNILVVQPT
jgi:hypothetical protein